MSDYAPRAELVQPTDLQNIQSHDQMVVQPQASPAGTPRWHPLGWSTPAPVVQATPTPTYETRNAKYIDDFLNHGKATADASLTTPNRPIGDIGAVVYVVLIGVVFLVMVIRFLIRCSKKTLHTIYLISGFCIAITLCILTAWWPAAIILSISLIRIIYMSRTAKATEAFQNSWKPEQEAGPKATPEPEPKAAPRPEPSPVQRPLFDSASLTEKERKLLALALDKAAQAGESEAAWVKFGKSLRGRGVGRH
jgi:hypothetical protein